jgi:hypothetical protein
LVNSAGASGSQSEEKGEPNKPGGRVLKAAKSRWRRFLLYTTKKITPDTTAARPMMTPTIIGVAEALDVDEAAGATHS